MQYVALGKTGLKISRVGFGGIPIQRIDAEKAAAEAERLAAEQAEAARLAAEAAQAEEAEAVPESAFEWWMIPVALGTFALGGGIVLLSLHSAARRRKKYTGKFVRK